MEPSERAGGDVVSSASTALWSYGRKAAGPRSEWEYLPSGKGGWLVGGSRIRQQAASLVSRHPDYLLLQKHLVIPECARLVPIQLY